jgi:exodeoxyribonuclease VII large subunit
MSHLLQTKIQTKLQELTHVKKSFAQHSVEKKLQYKQDEIKQLKEVFAQSMDFKLQNFAKELKSIEIRFPEIIQSNLNLAQNQLSNLEKMLKSNNPKFKTKKGFAQLSLNSQVINIESLNVDDVFEAQSDEVIIHAKVINKEYIL